MALSPAQMGASIRANLAAKSGRSLDEWLDVLHQSDATDRKSAIAVLKAAGLGHFQAQTVYEESIGADPYGDPDALVRELFPAELRDDYEAFAKTCRALGDEVVVRPCRTYVPFYAATQFAIVRPAAGEVGRLEIGLALPDDFTDEAAGEAPASLGSDRINRRCVLPAGGQPTPAQRAVLAAAYRHNCAA